MYQSESVAQYAADASGGDVLHTLALQREELQRSLAREALLRRRIAQLLQARRESGGAVSPFAQAAAGHASNLDFLHPSHPSLRQGSPADGAALYGTSPVMHGAGWRMPAAGTARAAVSAVSRLPDGVHVSSAPQFNAVDTLAGWEDALMEDLDFEADLSAAAATMAPAPASGASRARLTRSWSTNATGAAVSLQASGAPARIHVPQVHIHQRSRTCCTTQQCPDALGHSFLHPSSHPTNADACARFALHDLNFTLLFPRACRAVGSSSGADGADDAYHRGAPHPPPAVAQRPGHDGEAVRRDGQPEASRQQQPADQETEWERQRQLPARQPAGSIAQLTI